MLDKLPIDDQLLTRYLLGSLPDEDAERLDEMSIADDEIAWRLRALENDLVDAYVRGEMSGPALERFKASYLSSPQSRQKVAIASGLFSLEGQRAIATADEERPAHARWLATPRFMHWAVAASVVAIAAATYLFLAPQQHDDQVSREIAVGTTYVPQVTTTVQSHPVATISFLLQPPTRGAGPTAVVTVPAGTQQVILRLQLESDDFPAYQGALRDLATNEILWRSEAVHSAPEGRAMSVSMNVPGSILKQHDYSLELSGLPRGGQPEVIGSYTFRLAGN